MTEADNSETPKLSEYLTVKEAAEYLGVSASTLRNWDRQGKLKPYRHPVNDYRLYERKRLEELLNETRTEEKNGKGT